MQVNDFKEKLLAVGLTEEKFSILTNTPISTIKGWTVKRKNRIPKIPTWVTPYLKLYEQNKEQALIIKYLEDKQKNKPKETENHE